MKTIITTVLAVVFAGFAAKAQNNPPAPAPAQKVTASPVTSTPATTPTSDAEFQFNEMEYNFGTIKQGDVVNHEYKFTNTGKDPLIITNASGSCGCTVPDWPKNPIKKGESGVIKVTFNSSGKSGDQTKTVTINSNAKGSPTTLYIKGKVEMPAAQPAVNPAPAKIEPAAAPAKK